MYQLPVPKSITAGGTACLSVTVEDARFPHESAVFHKALATVPDLPRVG